MKRAVCAISTCLGIALIGSVAVQAQPGTVKNINVLTGDTRGVYYPLGVALAEIYRKALPNVKTSVQATQGSVENLNMLQAGRGEVAFSLGDTLSDAWRGEEEAGFRVPLKRLRVIAGIYQNYIQIVARADSGIKTLSDLKGKRISVGPLKSGTELNARAILRAAGLSYKDFARVDYLPFTESMELMKRRQLDVTLQSSGLGARSLRELAHAVRIAVVPISSEVVARVGDSAYQPGAIPARTYDGQAEAVPTATITNFLVTREEMPEDVVYQLTKSMFENLDRLTAAHSAAKGIKREAAAGKSLVLLHAGAEKYYREVGLIR